MRILVTGGRNFANRPLLTATLDRLHAERPITLVIHGAARGADTLAGEWAVMNGVLFQAYAADWERYGRSAGPRRNGEMLAEKPDLVVAFPGGAGTEDMKRRARGAGLEVLEVGAAPQCERE